MLQPEKQSKNVQFGQIHIREHKSDLYFSPAKENPLLTLHPQITNQYTRQVNSFENERQQTGRLERNRSDDNLTFKLRAAKLENKLRDRAIERKQELFQKHLLEQSLPKNKEEEKPFIYDYNSNPNSNLNSNMNLFFSQSSPSIQYPLVQNNQQNQQPQPYQQQNYQQKLQPNQHYHQFQPIYNQQYLPSTQNQEQIQPQQLIQPSIIIPDVPLKPIVLVQQWHIKKDRTIHTVNDGGYSSPIVECNHNVVKTMSGSRYQLGDLDSKILKVLVNLGIDYNPQLPLFYLDGLLYAESIVYGSTFNASQILLQSVEHFSFLVSQYHSPLHSHLEFLKQALKNLGIEKQRTISC